MGEFDQEFDSWAGPAVVQDANVFQTDKGVEDAGRLSEDEGIRIFDGHTSKTAMPSFLCVDATPVVHETTPTPPKSEEPRNPVVDSEPAM